MVGFFVAFIWRCGAHRSTLRKSSESALGGASLNSRRVKQACLPAKDLTCRV